MLHIKTIKHQTLQSLFQQLNRVNKRNSLFSMSLAVSYRIVQHELIRLYKNSVGVKLHLIHPQDQGLSIYYSEWFNSLPTRNDKPLCEMLLEDNLKRFMNEIISVD